MRKLALLLALPWAVVIGSSETYQIRYEGLLFSHCGGPLEACKDFVEAMNTAHEWRIQQKEERIESPFKEENIIPKEEPEIEDGVDTKQEKDSPCYDSYGDKIPCE